MDYLPADGYAGHDGGVNNRCRWFLVVVVVVVDSATYENNWSRNLIGSRPWAILSLILLDAHSITATTTATVTI
jgi:hypothetical protein